MGAVCEPTEDALNVFKKSLAQNGVKFSGKSQVEMKATPENIVLLTDKKSIPSAEDEILKVLVKQG